MIYNDLLNLAKFKLVDGDLSRFDDIVLNTDCETEQKEKLQDELYSILFEKESGEALIEFEDSIPLEFNASIHKQINIGFAP